MFSLWFIARRCICCLCVRFVSVARFMYLCAIYVIYCVMLSGVFVCYVCGLPCDVVCCVGVSFCVCVCCCLKVCLLDL